MNTYKTAGFTLLEMIIVIALVAVLSAVMLGAFNASRKNHSLITDRDAVASLLGQARSQTISSKNSSAYGVHFATSTATLFIGTTYSSATTTNQVFTLSNGITLTNSLSGGGSDVVFNRITGETNQYGTVTLSSTATSSTLRIYKTGIIEVVN